MVVAESAPDARVVAVPLENAASDGVFVPARGSAVLRLLAVRRNGSDGPIRVFAKGLPEGLSAEEAWIGPEETQGVWSVTATTEAAGRWGPLGIMAEVVTSAGRKVRPIAAFSVVRSGPLPSTRRLSALMAAVGPAAPLALGAQAHQKRVSAGSTLKVRISTRLGPMKVQGPLQLAAPLLPTKIALKPVEIEPNEGATVDLSIAAEAKPGPYSTAFQASAKYLPAESANRKTTTRKTKANQRPSGSRSGRIRSALKWSKRSSRTWRPRLGPAHQ